jgi:FkbM family methyltransferase
MRKLFLKLTAGKIKFQKYFEFLHSISVIGMNYGNGGDFRKSGESFAIQYVKSKLSTNPQPLILFDVGANVGEYSMELSNAFANTGVKIYSFEPSLQTFAAMSKTVSSRKEIIPTNFGLGENNETLKLFTDKSLSGLASVYQRKLDHIGVTMSNSEEIRIRKMDDFCKDNNIDNINFVKLDIEGHEYKCLLGAKELLKNKKIDFIQFEFGGCNIDSRTYFQDFWYLLNEDYHFYRILKNGLRPIANYKETLEIFTTINYLLEKKNKSN